MNRTVTEKSSSNQMVLETFKPLNFEAIKTTVSRFSFSFQVRSKFKISHFNYKSYKNFNISNFNFSKFKDFS